MDSFSRRTFLVTSAGLVLAACGSSKSSSSQAATSTSGSPTTLSNPGGSLAPGQAVGDLNLVQFFNDGVTAPGKIRLPFGLATKDSVVNTGGPETLTITITDDKGKPVGSTFSVPRHIDGVPRPYWPLELTLETVGVYTVTANVDGKTTAPAFFQVTAAADITIPKVGDKLLAIDTPTQGNKRGVNPICTKTPNCPLHDVSLTDALKQGKPVAFFIGTPLYCQTGVCGPELDLVLEQVQRVGAKAHVLHSEIYTDNTLKTTTDTVQKYKLEFEPTLYLTGADGVIRQRLDVIFDRAELTAAFDALVA